MISREKQQWFASLPENEVLSPEEIAFLLGKPAPSVEQQRVITQALDRPQLVVAAAGAGKTETMAQRVVYLVANGLVKPQEVLGLTFTRKAAQELQERIQARLETLADRHAGVAQRLAENQTDHLSLGVESQPVISTYNAFANRIITEWGAGVGMGGTKTVITQTRAVQIATQIVKNTLTDLGEAKENSVINAILGLNGQLNEHIWTDLNQVRSAFEEEIKHLLVHYQTHGWKVQKTVQSVVDSLQTRITLLDLVKEYRDFKQENGLIEFSDQVVNALNLIRDEPEIAQQIAAPFRIILLDEFQDTSTAQLYLFAKLFKGQAVTAVGDPNQSIYGWRGASELSMQAFLEQFETPDRPGISNSLTATYRNSPRVLEVANRLINDPQTGADWEDLFAHYSREAELLEFIPEAPRLPVPKAVSKNTKTEGEAYFYYAYGEHSEAQLIAEYLRKKWDEREEIAAQHPDWSADRLPSMAVLIRNHSQTDLLVQALRAVDLPVEVIGQAGLLYDPAVADIRAALNITADATRGDHLIRLLMGAGIGPRDLSVLWAWARRLARTVTATSSTDGNDGAGPSANQPVSAFLTDALDHLPPKDWCPPGATRGLSAAARPRLRLLSKQLAQLRKVADQPLPVLIGQAIRVFQLDIEIELSANVQAQQSQRCLEGFLDQAAQFEQMDERATLSDFLLWLDLAEDVERGMEAPIQDPNPNAIQISTIHQAKGLEWTYVVLPGWDRSATGSGRIPTRDWTGPVGKSSLKTSGWLTSSSALPFQMRKDRAVLPQLRLRQEFEKAAEIPKMLEAYQRALALHAMQEDRRLAYVAVTRAESEVLIGGAVTKENKTRCPSSFLLSLTGGVLSANWQVWDPEDSTGVDIENDLGGAGGRFDTADSDDCMLANPNQETTVATEKFKPLKLLPSVPEIKQVEDLQYAQETDFPWKLVPPVLNPSELEDHLLHLTNPIDPDTWDGRVEPMPLPIQFQAWPAPASPRQQALADQTAELWPLMTACAQQLQLDGAETGSEKQESLVTETAHDSSSPVCAVARVEELVKLCQLGMASAQGDDPNLLLHRAKQHSPWMERAAQLIVDRHQQENSRNRVYLPQQLAVTSMKQLLADPDGYARQLRRPLPIAPSVGAKLGTLFHQWADRFFNGQEWEIPDYLGASGKQNLQAWQENLISLGFEPIGAAALMQSSLNADSEETESPTSKQEKWAMLETEPEYVTQVGTTLVARIDAVARAPQTGRITILDWKTDTFQLDKSGQVVLPPPAVHQGYLRQINQYRLLYAAAHDLPVDQIDAALVYVGGPAIMPLTLDYFQKFPQEFPNSINAFADNLAKNIGAEMVR